MHSPDSVNACMPLGAVRGGMLQKSTRDAPAVGRLRCCGLIGDGYLRIGDRDVSVSALLRACRGWLSSFSGSDSCLCGHLSAFIGGCRADVSGSARNGIPPFSGPVQGGYRTGAAPLNADDVRGSPKDSNGWRCHAPKLRSDLFSRQGFPSAWPSGWLPGVRPVSSARGRLPSALSRRSRLPR